MHYAHTQSYRNGEQEILFKIHMLLKVLLLFIRNIKHREHINHYFTRISLEITQFESISGKGILHSHVFYIRTPTSIHAVALRTHVDVDIVK